MDIINKHITNSTWKWEKVREFFALKNIYPSSFFWEADVKRMTWKITLRITISKNSFFSNLNPNIKVLVGYENAYIWLWLLQWNIRVNTCGISYMLWWKSNKMFDVTNKPDYWVGIFVASRIILQQIGSFDNKQKLFVSSCSISNIGVNLWT